MTTTVPGPDGSLRLACFATQGTGHRDEDRIRTLLERFDLALLGFNPDRKPGEVVRLVAAARRLRPDLLAMEGTGVAGGIAVLLSRVLFGIPFVVSTGDAVAPFLRRRHWALGPAAAVYERALYRRAAGVIAWTPFLAGRALALGARRAMYAPNWAPSAATDEAGRDVRRELGLSPGDIVFGIAGSVEWNARVGYCYGSELVRAVRRVDRNDVKVVIVGDGSGRRHLERLAGPRLGATVLLPGRIGRDRVQAYLRAFDVGSLPQSVDQVGALRYTTKLSEYLAASLPIVTAEIPLAYEFGTEWLWRMPGDAPWEESYLAALAALMGTISRAEVDRRRALMPTGVRAFDVQVQIEQVTAFVHDLCRSPPTGTGRPPRPLPSSFQGAG
jgi:glycosyltransferase involved in cell wall biosynthesis